MKGCCESTKRVINFARELGFSVSRTRGGHLRFTRENGPTVFFSGSPSDRRSMQNGLSKLRRAAALH